MAEMKVALDGSMSGRDPAVTSLSAATTGSGGAADFGGAARNISMFLLVNGTVTGGVVDLQVSHDSVNWVKHASSAALGTGVNQKVDFAGAAYRYARAVVSTTVIGGGSVTATIMAS